MSLVFRTALFVIFIHGLFLVVLPYLLLAWGAAFFPFKAGFLRFLGVFPFMAGIAIYLSCVYEFAAVGKGTPAAWDSPKEFVFRGPYRFVRNPMYIGMVLILIAEAIFFESPVILAYALILWISFHLFVIYHEEPALKRRFGKTYEEYLRSVPRWIPRKGIPPLAPPIKGRG